MLFQGFETINISYAVFSMPVSPDHLKLVHTMRLLVYARFPRTLENLENEKINFQAWKSPGKSRIMAMSWKNSGNS